MDDERIWKFETSLWVGDAANYREKIADTCLMVLPTPPHVFTGEQAVAAVSDTPRWDRVTFSEERISRPQYGTIVIAYGVEAHREGGEPYVAHCTTVMQRETEDEWQVVQHQQTPRLAIG